MNIREITDETTRHLASGSDIVVGYSGGKDSTATCLRLFEMGYSKSDFIRLFFDTGWEDQATYDYLDQVQETIGEVTRIKAHIDITNFDPMAQDMIKELENDLGYESPFIRSVFKHYCWPSQFRKHCTTNIKINALKQFLDGHENDIINTVGVRREESTARANVSEWEWNEGLNCYTWRPLYLWTEADVIDIHHKFGLAPNSLYLNGAHRVGCFPCIYSRKAEIKALPKGRIDFISKIERMLGEFNHHRLDPNNPKHLKGIERLELNKSKTGFYFQSFFAKGDNTTMQSVWEWSQTARGGKQLVLFDMEEPTCQKWGLCDMSAGDTYKGDDDDQ